MAKITPIARDNGQPGAQQDLVRLDQEQLVHELARVKQKQGEAGKRRAKAGAELNVLNQQAEAILEEMLSRDELGKQLQLERDDAAAKS